MNIVYITAGAGGMHCGSCTRDAELVRALRAEGHDVLMLPLYTPPRVDGPSPAENRIFYGGINAWLQQHFSLFRRPLGALERLLDSPALLSRVSKLAVSTEARELGEMTVSVLKGREGRQKKELERLMDFLRAESRPDVVHITNTLLSMLAPEIKERLGVPVVCGLQGEAEFVEEFPEPWKDRAVELIRRHARSINAFTVPYDGYIRDMAGFLDEGESRFRVVPPGLRTGLYDASPRSSDGPLRIGYLSRINREKGIDLLVEAFRRLQSGDGFDVRLCVAGELPKQSKEFWRELRDSLREDGLEDRLDFRGEVDGPGKKDFLTGCDVMALPSRGLECRGMACLEALAAGVPIVVPERGIFPEIIERTGGGILFPPEEICSLAEAIEQLASEPETRGRMARDGRQGIEEHYSAHAAAEAALAVSREVVG